MVSYCLTDLVSHCDINFDNFTLRCSGMLGKFNLQLRPVFICLSTIICAIDWFNLLLHNTQNNKDHCLTDAGKLIEVLLDTNGEDGVIFGRCI